MSFTYNFDFQYEYKYGKIFHEVLKDNKKWKQITGSATLSDKNNLSFYKSYIDGEYIYIYKHNLAKYFSHLSYIPQTFIIENSKIDDLKFEEGVWFLKPSNKHIGAGECIKLIKNKQELEKQDLNVCKIKKFDKKLKIDYWVLQKNVSDPLLINNKKFAVRFLIVCLYNKQEFYIFNNKIFKINICPDDYVNNSLNLGVQMSHNNSEMTDDNSIQLWIKNGIFNPYEKRTDINFDMKMLIKKMRSITKDIFNKSSIKFNSLNNYGYCIYGLDFTFDNNMNAHLLEINESPFLSFPEKTLNIISKPMLSDLIMLLENPNNIKKVKLDNLKYITCCYIKNQ